MEIFTTKAYRVKYGFFLVGFSQFISSEFTPKFGFVVIKLFVYMHCTNCYFRLSADLMDK